MALTTASPAIPAASGSVAPGRGTEPFFPSPRAREEGERETGEKLDSSKEALMQKFFAEAGAGGGTRCRVPSLPVARARVGRTTRAPLSACEAAE